MKYKILYITAILFLCANFCFALESVFSHPETSKNIAKNMPVLKNAACTFTQEKTIGSTVLKSGGNFKFIKNKGAIFETEYPIKSTVSYTSSQNKQMNEVIMAISNKNYSYLDKNFDLYFIKNNDIWTVGLKPKQGSPASTQIYNIIVNGQVDIKQIKISTIKNGTTDISFKCGTK